uniref:Pecanex-like protein n=1 Tax=Steinernema glaseri TaxID=37863 RepID=A0A1I8A6H3_9BILA
MCSFESAVFAYSPRLGWCAANVYGRTEHDEWSNVGDGEWVSADLILAHSQNGRQPIVEWLVCPNIKPTVPLFNLPCKKPNTSFAVMEALAFNNVVTAEDHRGRRFIVLDTQLGEGSQSDANRSEISSQNQEETDKNEVPYGYPVNDATPLNEVAFSRDSPQGRGDRPVNSASSSERFSASPKISRKKSQDSLASGNQGYNLSEAFERELNPPTSSDEEPSMTSARHKQWQASILAKKTGNAASLKPPTPTAEPLRTGPPSVHSDARSTRGASISSGHANMQEAPKCGMAEAVASADQSSIVVTDEYDDDEEVMTQYGEVHGNEPQRPALNYEFSD